MNFSTLPELIARQARRTPDAVAVDSAGDPAKRLLYSELEGRARALALRLRAVGAGPGSRVGVCLPRRPGLVPALLAVWKAGASYVPLDPEHPAERLAWVLADAEVGVVVTDRASREAVSVPEGVQLLLVDDEADEDGADIGDGPRGEDPAYVLHTSGSTGRPKGVVVPHRGLANRVRRLAEGHGLGPGDRMLQKTTIGFDAAGLELFAPLVAGATVVLAPKGAERDPAVLLAAVARERITVLQAVPSVLRALVKAPGWEGCGALRLLFSAGEPLHADLCRQLAQRVPGVEIWNTYGPTECSVDITEHRWDPARDTGPVPIGRPLEGLRAVVLDAHGEPVPPGGEGELYAAGAGVALGYFGRPALTAERFIPDPSGPPGSRAYRTGDRVRIRPDGVLEYLGRGDQQLKVNGVRIEPDEVEAGLVRHPRVDAAVVGAVPDGAGGQSLAAWIQVRGTAPAPAELRAFLRRFLPQTMLPAVFVPLAAFPRTASGKTDRAALPVPVAGTRDGAEAVPPRNAAERAVAALWAELLEIPADSVGVHDDFFARGGSSLLLAQLAARLRADGARVAPGDLFAAATVESQAALAAAAPQGAAVPDGPDRPVVPLPRPVEGLPLASGQRGMWLLDQISPGSPEWVSPQWVRLPAAWSEETVRKALTRLADRHEILRTHYTARSGTPVQQVRAPGGPVSLDVVRTDTREDVEELTGRELARGFDLEEGPVWRSVLLPGATAPGEDGADHLLLLLTHHICCDGWSSVLLERDLLAFARALHTGTETVLPDVPVQFADHAAWELSRGEEALAGDLAHWRTVLDGVTPLDLPTDRTRPAERQGLGGMVAKALPAGLAGSAAALGRSRGATLHQTLLTAFCVLLTRLTGRNDVTIGMPVAGRHRPETAQTVGFFLNTLVLRCRTDAGGSGLDALETVRDTVLEALAHQEVPFDRLVRELEPGRDPSRTPLHQVTFDFHEEGRTATALPEPALAALSHGWRTSRTDLALLVQERPDGSLLARAHYDSALFDRATAERFLDCWMQLLESLVTSPTAPLDSLALLPESEHERLIAIGAPKDADPGTAACVYTAFAETARRIPEATAVECGEQRLGYAELHARAAAVADALRVHGAGAERTVAVLLPRSADLVAAFLGIWRSGAAAVPLDVESPDDRLAHIVSDADVTAVLTDAAGARRLAAHYAGPFVITDSLTPTTAPPAPGEPVSEIDRSASRLAYVIYTSGTTGRPKGVAVEHQALHRMLRAGGAHLRFGEGADDAWLALATPTFDIAFTELVMPLLAGGRIVVAREEEITDAPALLKLMDHHGVTHVQVGHPQWRMLIDAGLGTRALTGQTGGEPCPPSLARDLAGRLTRFVNEYGLTETTIAATRAEITTRSATVPVGSPYPHTTARVLDPMLRPVPPGTAGELCIGGHGLFRGYLADPARTASRLLPDPYGPPGSRLLRTGDLARMEPDGTLHFMGRADGQVKIRGRRVETEEVRSVLIDHPAVGEAVVTARGSGEEVRLVAYCVPAAGRELPYAGELLDHCATSLPEYMLPTYIVPIEKVPFTRHRKVDTAALPDPDRTAADREESYVAPEGDLEEALVRIWGEVLAEPGGTPPRIGTRTGFFRLGGDSLRAARLIARIREVYGVRLAPRTVFDQPTVAGLARAVEEAVRAELAQLSDEELEAAQEEFRP